MTAVIHLRCTECGAALTDKYSRTIGLDAGCRDELTDADLRTATARRAERRPSPQARQNHAEIERLTDPTPGPKRCTAHGEIPSQCALCRRDNDRPAERIITITQRLPRTERLERERAAARHHWRAYLPQSTQLTIGG